MPEAGRSYDWILGMSGLLPAEIIASLRPGSARRQRYIRSNIALAELKGAADFVAVAGGDARPGERANRELLAQ
jgi:hypothetical protein